MMLSSGREECSLKLYVACMASQNVRGNIQTLPHVLRLRIIGC